VRDWDRRCGFFGTRCESRDKIPLVDGVRKVRRAPRPLTKKTARSFLVLTGEHIPKYDAVAAPLSDLLKKGQPKKVLWGEAQEQAYVSLKTAVTNRPILHLPDHTKLFILRADASSIGVGAVVLQNHNGQLFPVAFGSKKLSDREKKFSTIKKECLSIVWSVQRFAPCLYGKEFILQTDHQPLVYLQRTKFINDRIMRWALYLQDHLLRIEVIKGSENLGSGFHEPLVCRTNLTSSFY
jgi:hypothetical protein